MERNQNFRMRTEVMSCDVCHCFPREGSVWSHNKAFLCKYLVVVSGLSWDLRRLSVALYLQGGWPQGHSLA